MKNIVFFIVLIFSAIISGMGIGGGGIFIMLSSLTTDFSHKQLQIYNLILFIAVGFTATINNLKNKIFDKKIFLKIIFLLIAGVFVGIYFNKIVSEEISKMFFYVFMLVIGIYEIISSINTIKKTKNNNV